MTHRPRVPFILAALFVAALTMGAGSAADAQGAVDVIVVLNDGEDSARVA